MNQTTPLTNEEINAFFYSLLPWLETAFWICFLVVAFQIRNAVRKSVELLEALKKNDKE